VGQAGAGGQLHVVEHRLAGDRVAVQVHPLHLGQVLVQRAAQGHVEDLQAPADGQHGQAHVDGCSDQGQLGLVALGVGAVHLGVLMPAVAPRLYVAPSGQDQAVERGQSLLGRHRSGRRQQHGPGPGPGQGGHVALGQGVAAA
jgi:hypothetical protein